MKRQLEHRKFNLITYAHIVTIIMPLLFECKIKRPEWRINFNSFIGITTKPLLQDLSSEWSTQYILLIARIFHSCFQSGNCLLQSLHVHQIADQSYFLSQWPYLFHVDYVHHWLYFGFHHLLFCRDARCPGFDTFSLLFCY